MIFVCTVLRINHVHVVIDCVKKTFVNKLLFFIELSQVYLMQFLMQLVTVKHCANDADIQSHGYIEFYNIYDHFHITVSKLRKGC